MKIYLYIHHSFPDAVQIGYRNTGKPLSIRERSAAAGRQLRSLIDSSCSGTLSVPKPVEIVDALYAIRLAIETDPFSSRQLNVLVIGSEDLNGELKLTEPPYRFRDVATRYHCRIILVPKKFRNRDKRIRQVTDIPSALRTLITYKERKEKRSDPLDNIEGAEKLKGSLLLSLGGFHPILLFGPPGCGKTLTLSTMKSITEKPVFSLSPSTSVRELEKARIASLFEGGLIIADELDSFSKGVKGWLKTHMDERSFLVAAAMNCCPCGARGLNGVCRCSEREIEKYWAKTGYPLLDRFHLRVPVPADVRTSVCKALPLYRSRFKERAPRPPEQSVLRAVEKKTDTSFLTPRGIEQCALVAKTISQLSGEPVSDSIIEEAIEYQRYGLWSSSFH